MWRRLTAPPPASPKRSNSPSNAAATTTVGSTNGTVAKARSRRWPRKRSRAIAPAAGSATATVSAVDAAACQTVNQITERCDSEPSTSPSAASGPAPPSPRPTTPAMGHTKNSAMKHGDDHRREQADQPASDLDCRSVLRSH